MRRTAAAFVLGVGLLFCAEPRAAEPESAPILRLDLGQHSAKIQRIAVSADASVVATGAADGSVRMWTMDGHPLARYHLPLGEDRIGEVTALALSASGKTVLAATKPHDTRSGQTTSRLYYMLAESGRIVHQIDVAYQANDGQSYRIGGAVEHIAFSAEGRHFGLAAGPWGWQVLRSDSTKIAGEIAPDDPVNWIAFSVNDVFAVVHQSGQIVFRQILEDGGITELGRFVTGGGGAEPASIAFSPDGRELAIGNYDQASVDVLDLASLKIVRRLEPRALSDGSLSAVAWAGQAGEPGWLYAAGRMQIPGGSAFAAAVWQGGDGEAGLRELTQDSVTHLVGLADGGALFASADPTWGRIDAVKDTPDPGALIGSVSRGAEFGRVAAPDLTARTRVAARTLDFRYVGARGFALSADGTEVWVRPNTADTPPLYFDLKTLAASSRSDAPSGSRLSLGRPAQGPVSVGVGGRRLEINDQQVFRAEGTPVLASHERVLSVDPVTQVDGENHAIVGTDYHLLSFDERGREAGRLSIRSGAWAVLKAEAAPVAVAALRDGTIRWYAIGQDGSIRELAAVFLHPDRRRWAAWTFDGFFAHSDFGGAGLIGYHLNGTSENLTGRWMAFERLYHVLYKPEIVSGVLADAARWPEIFSRARLRPLLAEDAALGITIDAYCPLPNLTVGTRSLRALPSDAEGFADAGAFCRKTTDITEGRSVRPSGDPGDLLPPGTRALDLVIDLGHDRAPPRRVDLFVNGRNAGRFDLEAVQSGRVVLSAPITDALSQVSLRFHRNDGVYDTTDPLYFEREAATEAELASGALHILGVGVNSYSSGIGPLKRASLDASSTVSALHSAADGLYASVPDPAVLLDDRATRQDVLDAFDGLIDRVRPEDSVIVYLAGHASVSAAGEYVFVPQDASSPALLAQEGLRADDLIGAIGQLTARNVLVVLDTCYAGAFKVDGLSKLAHDTGRIVFAASASAEEALDNPEGFENGLFAHSFLAGLSGGAAVNGTVDAVSLGLYLRDEVKHLAAQVGHQQKAVLRVTDGALTEFPLARPVTVQ